MSDDWQPGDLALCVDNAAGPGRRWVFGCDLRRGGIYTVHRVWLGESGVLLTVVEVECTTDTGGFSTRRFRKIRPHEADEEDRETIRLLTGAPVKEPAA